MIAASFDQLQNLSNLIATYYTYISEQGESGEKAPQNAAGLRSIKTPERVAGAVKGADVGGARRDWRDDEEGKVWEVAGIGIVCRIVEE